MRTPPAALPLSVVVVLLSCAVSLAHPPRAADFEVFADGLDGPEDLAFTNDGRLIVGSVVGEPKSFEPDGEATLLATVEDPIAGVAVLADGRVLAASVPGDRVWAITPDGEASVFAEGIGGPNFIVQTRREGRILVSASNGNAIVDITSGAPEVVIPDVEFANGLAIRESGGARHLYVAKTLASEVVRFRMYDDGSFGPSELYAAGLLLADGLAFDASGNLLVVGGGQLNVVTRGGRVESLSDDPLIDWPANLAFGQGPGWSTREVYLANFGPNFGDGTDVVRFRYNHRGAPLASAGLEGDEPCGPSSFLRRRTPLRGGAIDCPRRTSVRRLAVRP